MNALSIILLVCTTFLIGAFVAFVINRLASIRKKLDEFGSTADELDVRIYMNNIPKSDVAPQLTAATVPIDTNGSCFISVPSVGEEVIGLYTIGEQRFALVGTVISVATNYIYNFVSVQCECSSIFKLNRENETV